MMVGGNIEGKTRVLTTAIMLETNRGNFTSAIVLGVVLMLLALLINIVVNSLKEEDHVS
jgi:tungstate transport system permease protein